MNDLTSYGHNYVLDEAKEVVVPALREMWEKKGRIDPFVMMWPRKKVEWIGVKTNQTVGFGMPKDRSTWPRFLAEQALKHAAFAVLLTEQKENEVVSVLESRAGTYTWRLPVEDHGDLQFLGDPVERADTDTIGLLWEPGATE